MDDGRKMRGRARGFRNSQRYFKDSKSVVKLLASIYRLVPPAKDRTLAKEKKKEKKKKKKKKGARAKVMAGR